MRKESLEIARAFARGEKASAARTMTDGTTVWLHGNRIAWRDEDGSVRLTLAGWGTVTTRDRLNTLCFVLRGDRPFHQKDHVQYFGTSPIESDDVVLLGFV